MENRQDTEKIAEINKLLLVMIGINVDFLTNDTGAYFDYVGVLDLRASIARTIFRLGCLGVKNQQTRMNPNQVF